MADIIPFPAKPTIEIYKGFASDPRFSGFGEVRFYVAVNETNEEDDVFIMWDGTSREEAWKEARELAKDFETTRIVERFSHT
jgi:hypothetical protein